MVLLQRKLYCSKDSEGSNIFQRGPTFFYQGGGGGGGGGGLNADFYRNPHNL